MGQGLLADSRAKGEMNRAALSKGIAWGLIGGLAGTIVMDLVLVGTLSAVGLSVVIPFSTIGDTAAGFFGLISIELTGGFPLGAAVYCLLGLVLGAIFGAAVTRLGAHRMSTLKRGIALAVLYAEVLSQPILATSPLILKMTAAETVLWFGVSAVMHLIWGIVLGAVVSYGFRSASVTQHSGIRSEPIPRIG